MTMWLLGMLGVAEGLRVIDIVQSPLSESLATFDGTDLGDAAQRAFVREVSSQSRVTLPLGIAQLLLGAMLAVVSVRALLWRRGSRSLVLQLLAANALLAIVHYLLHDPVRRAVVEAIVAHLAAQRPPDIGPSEYADLARTNVRWGFRLWLTAQLAGFAFASFVITRQSVHAFLTGAKSPTDSRRP
jgi:hypothetical protein